jgi:predicted GIY-YIG superfamily endonuclease
MPNKIKRDTHNYNLKSGKKIVYKGTTNDLDKRAKEHKDDGKKFTHMQKTGRVKTTDGASKEEARQLSAFRRSHGGKNPKYNKTDNG